MTTATRPILETTRRDVRTVLQAVWIFVTLNYLYCASSR